MARVRLLCIAAPAAAMAFGQVHASDVLPTEVADRDPAPISTAGQLTPLRLAQASESSSRPGSQVSPSGASEQHEGLQEIVVTARKRVESLVEVPTSVTVFGAEALKDLKIESVTDYITKMPSVAYTYGQGTQGMAGARTISIRGISGTNVTGFYIDDVPVPDSLDPRVVDLERIEALKGPQGTLYGAGSMGGNVRLITHKPSLTENGGELMTQVGQTTGSGGTDYGGSATTNIVLVDGKLGLRVVGFGQEDSGYINRRFPNDSGGFTVDKHNGAVTSFGGSATMLWRATDAFEVNGKLMYQASDGVGEPTVYLPITEGFRPSSYTITRLSNSPESYVRKFFLPSLTLSYAWPSAATLSSVTAYYEDYSFDNQDDTEGVGGVVWNSGAYVGYQYPEWAPIPVHIGVRAKSMTHETRLSFEPVGNLSGTVGFFYRKRWSRSPTPHDGIFFPAPGLAAQGLAPTDETISTQVNVDDKQYALFSELYYSITDALKLTAGARYYRLQTHIDGFTDGVAYVGTPLFIFGQRNEWNQTTPWESGVSPKVALQYDAAPGTSIYASASKGFRPGGANTPLAAFCSGGEGSVESLGYSLDSALSFKSDSVWNYEIGVKRQTENMFIAAAAYRINWSGIQQTVTVPKCALTFTANSGAGRVDGGEVEMTVVPLAGLELHAAVGYNDAKITDQGQGVALVGSRIQEVPDWTNSASVTYKWARSVGGWKPFVSADYVYVGSALTSTIGSVTLVRQSYGLLNARIGMRKDNLELTLYGENLTNERVQLGTPGEIGAAPRDPNDPTFPLLRGLVSRPLSFGLQARYNF